MSQGFTVQNGNIIANGIILGDSANIDAFSRLRASNPQTLFETKLSYGINSIQFESSATGTGIAPAFDTNTRMASLVSSGAGLSYMQSNQYMTYQPGKSLFMMMTGVLNTGVAGVRKDFGYFDTLNGIFYRQDGVNGLQIIRRTSTNGSVVDNIVQQANWNVDPLNGSGKSGITLDATKCFILVIDLQFLGMGRVRVGFDIDGVIYYAHQFLNANNLAVPYMQYANLPVQIAVSSTGSAASSTANFKCATVISEGGLEIDMGYHFGTGEATGTAGSGTRTPLMSLRPKTTFNSMTNRVQCYIESFDLNNTGGTNDIFYELAVGADMSGQTFSDVNTTFSSFECTTGTNVGTLGSLTGGYIIDCGYVPAATKASSTISTHDLNERMNLTLDRAGNVRKLGTLTLFVTGIGGTSTCRAAIHFKEVR